MRARQLCDCEVSERILYTCFLLLVGIGYLMALAYLYISHENHDGKPGLSLEDIAENYYGNRSGTRLEAAIRGPMSGYIERQQRNYIVSWLISGAPETDYQTIIRPILQERCFTCHGSNSGTNLPDFSTFEGLRKVAKVDTGVSLQTLLKLSHIHLFGIGLVLLAVGMIFRRVRMRTWLKSTLIVLPFFAVFIDILAWFLTKWDPHYAYTVVAAGAILGLALGGQILSSLYQMWVPSKPKSPIANE